MPVIVPPIKSQGIKTKLVPWINDLILQSGLDLLNTNWVEPFFGTGVVGLNAPVGGNRYIADSNPHIINFYNGVLHGEITPQNMREYLEHEGSLLAVADEEGGLGIITVNPVIKGLIFLAAGNEDDVVLHLDLDAGPFQCLNRQDDIGPRFKGFDDFQTAVPFR